MLKDATHKEKLDLLNKLLPELMRPIRGDIKNDHLRQDAVFLKRYFGGKNPNKLTAEELAEGYRLGLKEHPNPENVVDFLFQRWLLKHSEIYPYFEQALYQINPNFSELVEIDREPAMRLMTGSVQEFGAINTYLFTVINSVVFPKEVVEILRDLAEEKQKEQVEQHTGVDKAQSVEAVKLACEQEIVRLTDRYEKKLQGLQKKYLQDTEALKKQIAALQRKLNV